MTLRSGLPGHRGIGRALGRERSGLMAPNEIHVDASPERVFEVLSDPSTYGHWVVGSSHIRDADDRWPEPGTRIHHTVGWGPLKIDDHTSVISSHPPTRLELKAKARPLGTAHVVLIMAKENGGTRVTMIEDAGDRLTGLVFNPLTH